MMDTALVAMPFADADRPCIQVGLLAAIAARHGYPVRTLHANLDFAARIGVENYRLLAEHRGRMVGEWLFSVEAFGTAAPDPHGRFLTDFAPDLGYIELSLLERIWRDDVPAYLDALVESFPWSEVRVVGFTSTHQQNAASFALARRLKRRFPGLVTVFGGANFDGEMGLELVRTVDCIDYAVIGEGDTAFPALLDALASGTDPLAVPGVVDRAAKAVAVPPQARMDELPPPDYNEYFERAERLGLLPRGGHRDVWIPFEAARGCWWGAKHHCTFCGLNGTTMDFRAKPAEQVLDELAHQARRYHSFRFEAVDNIMDMSYLRTLLPALVDGGFDYQMFYEVKANLTRAQLRLMAQAGLGHIQPGVESLSSHVLHLMRKGVRAAQNVNLLRWAQYYGIQADWNMLWGFPGETKEDYDDQAALVPHLVHLRPPKCATRIWMERFSPLYSSPARSRTPEASYRYVYPDRIDLDRVAYFFDYTLDEGLPEATYAALSTAIDEWSRRWQPGPPPILRYWSAPDYVQIYDGRHEGREGTYTFRGAIANIFLACSDRPMTATGVHEKLDLPVGLITEVFEEFAQRGLMFLDWPFALVLPLPAVGGR